MRGRGALGVRTALACVGAVTVLIGDPALSGRTWTAPALAVSVDDVLAAMPFSEADDQRIRNGELVSTRLTSSTNRELAVAMAFTMKTPPAAAVTAFRNSIYRGDPKIIGWGRVDGAGTLTDFQKLTLGPQGADEAQKFLDATPGETLNLSTQEIAAFAALKAQQPGAAQAQALVEQQLRSMLLARLQAYRDGGLAAVAPYDRGAGRLLHPGEQLKDATTASSALNKFAGPVGQLLLDYPASKPPQLDESFHWAVYDISGRPTVVLSHRMWTEVAGAAIMVDRLYYVSNGFNTEQALGGFVGVPEGTMVFYANRTSTDQVDGFGSAAKRAIGDHMMENDLSATFQKLRQGS